MVVREWSGHQRSRKYEVPIKAGGMIFMVLIVLEPYVFMIRALSLNADTPFIPIQ
jgi:hypothetical protein